MGDKYDVIVIGAGVAGLTVIFVDRDLLARARALLNESDREAHLSQD